MQSYCARLLIVPQVALSSNFPAGVFRSNATSECKGLISHLFPSPKPHDKQTENKQRHGHTWSASVPRQQHHFLYARGRPAFRSTKPTRNGQRNSARPRHAQFPAAFQPNPTPRPVGRPVARPIARPVARPVARPLGQRQRCAPWTRPLPRPLTSRPTLMDFSGTIYRHICGHCNAPPSGHHRDSALLHNAPLNGLSASGGEPALKT